MPGDGPRSLFWDARDRLAFTKQIKATKANGAQSQQQQQPQIDNIDRVSLVGADPPSEYIHQDDFSATSEDEEAHHHAVANGRRAQQQRRRRPDGAVSDGTVRRLRNGVSSLPQELLLC